MACAWRCVGMCRACAGYACMACAPTHLVWHFYHLAPVTVGGERSAVEPGEPDLVQRTGTFHGMNGWMDGRMGG